MDSSDSVAVVALLVSLVALIVTLLQALQQYFATAEGYRNCAESVIGPWHKMRRRRFVPSELRFETVYEAPVIRLVSPQELRQHYGHGKVHMLNPSGGVDTMSGLLRDTVHPTKHAVEKWYRRWLGRFSNGRSISDDGEKNETSAETKAEPENDWVEREDETALVSWIFFLRELHRAYQRYWPQDCTACQAGPDSGAESESRAAESSHAATRNMATRIDPVIIQKTFHWDFFASGITRPVAMTTVGHIISLALRMGMQWRTIEPQNGKMQAMGNGYSLASVPMSQGGLMLTFTATGGHKKAADIIPSVAADKMLFGILPGDPVLVKRDFHLIGPNGRLRHATTVANTIIFLEFEESEMDLAKTRFLADFTKLLCPFFPLEGSTVATVRFPGWSRYRAPSLLHRWESRLALLQQLDKEVTWRAGQHDQSDPELHLLRGVKEQLEALRLDCPEYFYDPRYIHFLITTVRGAKEDRKLKLLDSCRWLADTCTTALVQSAWDRFARGADSEPEAWDLPTRYTRLVSAHAFVALQAVEAGEQDFVGSREGGSGGGQMRGEVFVLLLLLF